MLIVATQGNNTKQVVQKYKWETYYIIDPPFHFAEPYQLLANIELWYIWTFLCIALDLRYSVKQPPIFIVFFSMYLFPKLFFDLSTILRIIFYPRTHLLRVDKS